MEAPKDQIHLYFRHNATLQVTLLDTFTGLILEFKNKAEGVGGRGREMNGLN
jgi:hypothetical protein